MSWPSVWSAMTRSGADHRTARADVEIGDDAAFEVARIESWLAFPESELTEKVISRKKLASLTATGFWCKFHQGCCRQHHRTEEHRRARLDTGAAISRCAVASTGFVFLRRQTLPRAMSLPVRVEKLVR